jgi:SAM-dependent methyltransferase
MLDRLSQKETSSAVNKSKHMYLKKWFLGVYSEVEFWRVWMRTRGAFWRSEHARRLDQNAILDTQAASLLPANVPASQLKILDVGSGPLSGLGVIHNGQHVSILAVDPLANAYQRMYQDFGITPVIPVTLAFAEDLTSFFAKDEFDLVVCQNALDHTHDPWRALRQMIEVSKPGGFVLLRHSRNEAENERYSGLHQWNLDTSSVGDFVIWNKDASLNVTHLLAGQVDIRLLESAAPQIVIALSKRPGVTLFDADDARKRLREILTELSDTAISLGREGFCMKTCFAFKTYAEYFINKLTRLF